MPAEVLAQLGERVGVAVQLAAARFAVPEDDVLGARRALFGDYRFTGRYKPHPDPNQEAFFFGLLRECLDEGLVTEAMLREEMARNHIRHDALELLDRVPPLAA